MFRRWSLRRELFDVPNERSSHTIPTPRGGGAVIAALSLIGYTIYSVFIINDFNWAYASGAALIAVISWFDDLHSISFYWRFLAHSFAALLVISNAGYFQEIFIPLSGKSELGAVGAVLTFLWIVWLTNAYNFMDGIDGIAGMQAIVTGFGWLIVGKLLGWDAVGFYGGVIASSSLGFLVHNWQPASIFMGDVGSAFLGYTFAVLPILALNNTIENSQNRQLLPAIAILLVWLFVFDTLVTFLRRLLNGEKVWEPHRRHIYQKLIIGGFSHRAVAGLYGILAVLIAGVLLLWIVRNGIWERILICLLIVQTIGFILCPLVLPKGND